MILIVFVIVTGIVLYAISTPTPPPIERFHNYDQPTKFEKLASLYSPIITRPKDIVAPQYKGNCRNELYPSRTSPYGKGEMGQPCSPSVEAKYYAMRPILTPSGLQDMIKILFKYVTQKVPNSVNQNALKHQNQFCDGNNYTKLMKYIMERLNRAQANTTVFKDYAKSDTWGGDMFAYLNEQVFMFTEQDPSLFTEQEQAIRARKKLNVDTKYVVTFTLYLPLRSTSFDVTSIVIRHKNQYFLKYIDYTTKDKFYESGEPETVNIEHAVVQPDADGLPSEQNTPNWIYGNTLENRTFNMKGFHDPDESKNILIPGGVPEEYARVLQECDQGYLMKPSNSSGPRFKGGFQSDNSTMAPPIYPNFPNESESWNVHI